MRKPVQALCGDLRRWIHTTRKSPSRPLGYQTTLRLPRDCVPLRTERIRQNEQLCQVSSTGVRMGNRETRMQRYKQRRDAVSKIHRSQWAVNTIREWARMRVSEWVTGSSECNSETQSLSGPIHMQRANRKLLESIEYCLECSCRLRLVDDHAVVSLWRFLRLIIACCLLEQQLISTGALGSTPPSRWLRLL